MAYLDHRPGRNQRVAVMGIVAVIQGAAIVALVNGLAVHFLKPAPAPNPQATDIPVMPLPTPIPPPAPKTPDLLPRADPVPYKPLTQLGLGEVVVPPMPPLPPIPDPVPTQELVRPSPSPSPGFTPRWAKPRNAPASWATANDYPARDLREGNQGTTRFALSIGADGRVLSCAVTVSSGYPGLDKATCDNVSRRARFEPATDGGGNRVGGSYAGAIHWVIPQD